MENYWDVFWNKHSEQFGPDQPRPDGPELLRLYHEWLLSEGFINPDKAAKLRANITRHANVLSYVSEAVVRVAEIVKYG